MARLCNQTARFLIETLKNRISRLETLLLEKQRELMASKRFYSSVKNKAEAYALSSIQPPSYVQNDISYLKQKITMLNELAFDFEQDVMLELMKDYNETR